MIELPPIAASELGASRSKRSSIGLLPETRSSSSATGRNDSPRSSSTDARDNCNRRRSSTKQLKAKKSAASNECGTQEEDAAALKPAKKGAASLRSKRVDDQMNHEHLQQLEQIFKEGSAGEEGLDMEQFRIAMKKTMGSHIDDTELDMIFMKVDNNCDGTVDWDEYLSYMLLEYHQKKNMFTFDQDCPFPSPPCYVNTSHGETICSMRFLQALSARQTVDGVQEPDDSASRYLTLTRDGVLNIWNIDWTLQKSTTLESARAGGVIGGASTNNGPGQRQVSVTDMVCMTNCNTVAVATTDYEVSFYTMTSNMIQKRFQIKDLKDCALTMDYYYDIQDPKHAILLWGDTSGSLTVIRFHENPNLSLFAAPLCPLNRISMIRVLRGYIHGIKAAKYKGVHGDWVQQVRYYVNKKGQECVISGCVKEDTALFFADITEKVRGGSNRKMLINRSSHFHVRKGVLCLSYDPEWNLIVTGSRDCEVRVWNPYVVSKSAAVLKGHNTAVLHVLVRNCDHQVISISKDKNVRVWDLRDYSCKQSIHGRNLELGRLDITAVCFNERQAELAVANSRIAVLRPRNPSSTGYKQVKLAKSHQKAVVRVLYNPLFNQLVTGGEDSMVCLWDIKTGVKQMQFCTGTEAEITCMAFDQTNRRLLTGGRDGSATMWNFNNGAKLRCLDKMDGQEINDVAFTRQRIVTAGWNRHVGVYLDSYGDDRCSLLRQKHKDDILSLDYHRSESTFASASYDGDIFLWSLDSGDVLMTYNMHRSLFPVHLEEEEMVSKEERKRSSGERMQVSSCDEVKSGREMTISNCNSDGSTTSQPVQRLAGRRSAMTREIVLKRSDVWLPSNLPWLKKRRMFLYGSENEATQSDHDVPEVTSTSSASTSATSSRATSSRSRGDFVSQIADRAIYKLLFFQTRSTAETVGSLMSACAGGWMCMWSIHQRGGMLGYFHACKNKNSGDFVTTMVTDAANKVLVTADSRGYIRVWNVETYCNGADVAERRNSMRRSSSCEKIHQEEEEGAERTKFMPNDQAPHLKMSVRAHVRSVTSLAYVDESGLIASGGVDGSVRLWTDCGRYIGTFGQAQPWSIRLPVHVKSLPSDMPSDVRRVASPTTLRTSKGQVHAQWRQVKHAVNFLNIHTTGAERDKSRTAAAPKKRTKVLEMLAHERSKRGSIQDRLSQVTKALIEESSPFDARPTKQRRGSVTVWLEDVPHSIIAQPEPIDQVEQTFLRIQTEGLTSQILGKVNYKPKKRHRRATIDTEIRWCNKHAVIYNSLPYAVLVPPTEPACPAHLKRQRERCNARQALNVAQRKVMAANAIRRTSTLSSPPSNGGGDQAKHSRIKLPAIQLKPGYVAAGGGGVLRNEAGNKIVVKQQQHHHTALRQSNSKQRQPSPLIATLPSIA